MLEGTITGNSSEANHALTYLQVIFPEQPDRRAKKAEAGSELISGPDGFFLNVDFPPRAWPGAPRLSPHPPRTLRAQHMDEQRGLGWWWSLQGASLLHQPGQMAKGRLGRGPAWHGVAREELMLCLASATFAPSALHTEKVLQPCQGKGQASHHHGSLQALGTTWRVGHLWDLSLSGLGPHRLPETPLCLEVKHPSQSCTASLSTNCSRWKGCTHHATLE